MDRRLQISRALVFLLAASVLVGVAIALSLGGNNPESDPDPRPSSQSLEALALDAMASESRPSPDEAAERFARAYLEYELGRHTPLTRQTIRDVGSKSLQADLLGAPVRVPPGSQLPKERLLGITSTTPTVGGDGRVEVAALAAIRRNGRRAHLTVRLVLNGSRWLVVGVGP